MYTIDFLNSPRLLTLWIARLHDQLDLVYHPLQAHSWILGI